MSRSIQTKIDLANTLKMMMQKIPLDKISIKELTDATGVNRQTFYYHFSDIYDLLRWTLQQEAIIHLQDKQLSELWQDGLLSLFKYLEDNKAFALSALSSLGFEHLNRFFFTEINGIVSEVVYKLGETIQADKKYMNFLSHYYTRAMSSLVISWLQGEMEDTPEEIIAQIDLTLQDHFNGSRMRVLGKL